MRGQDSRKIGIAATRSVGGAVARNRHRRKLKEFYRLNKDIFAPDGHYFFLMRAPITGWHRFEDRLRLVLADVYRLPGMRFSPSGD